MINRLSRRQSDRTVVLALAGVITGVAFFLIRRLVDRVMQTRV